MRTIMVSSNPSQRTSFRSRFSQIHKADDLVITKSLKDACTEVGIHPPKVAVIEHCLAAQPEFEVLLSLLAKFKSRVVVLRKKNERTVATPRHHLGAGVVFLDEAVDDTGWRDSLGLSSTRSEPTGRVIMIGSSTGGIEALIEVLSSFDLDCAPTFLVQHTGGTFSAGLARLLNGKAQIRVCEAEDGMVVTPGTAVLAPGDKFHLQMCLDRREAKCRLIDQAPYGGHRPAVDILFQSGVPNAPRVVAALLTGMGRDGAAGLLALKNAGARTFGQDEETSLVYGMPKVAAELGAVEQQLPLDRIGPALIAASSERRAA